MQAAYVVTQDEQFFATVFDEDRVVAAIEVDDPDPALLREHGVEAVSEADHSLALEVGFALKAGSAFEIGAHLEANV